MGSCLRVTPQRWSIAGSDRGHIIHEPTGRPPWSGCCPRWAGRCGASPPEWHAPATARPRSAGSRRWSASAGPHCAGGCGPQLTAGDATSATAGGRDHSEDTGLNNEVVQGEVGHVLHARELPLNARKDCGTSPGTGVPWAVEMMIGAGPAMLFRSTSRGRNSGSHNARSDGRT